MSQLSQGRTAADSGVHGQRVEALASIIGRDPALLNVLARTELVAVTSVPVLIGGESGTGKELLARAVHELSRRWRGPLVAVNCGALPRELAESELFGHERGAFTGAIGRRTGWFEEAAGGTLVLDEIGELPLELQPKLLRVLETGRLRRVGGSGEVTVDVRLIAMSLRDLRREVTRGAFRADLFHRLAGFELWLPPLRCRRGDIAMLVEHFLNELEPELGQRTIALEALQALSAHDWPGNVRELRNTVRRAAILSGARIELAALELAPVTEPWMGGQCVLDASGAPAASCRDGELPHIEPQRASTPSVAGDTLMLAGRTFEEIEREVLAWALRRNGGSRRRAAHALGVSRSTFCDKVKRYGIA